MQNNLNAVLSALIAVMIISAYKHILADSHASCYLTGAVICAQSGDLITTRSKTCAGSSGTVYYNIYADEEAYRTDYGVVTAGGYNPYSTIVACCNNSADVEDDDNNGFAIHWVDPCSGQPQQSNTSLEGITWAGHKLTTTHCN